jgi:hypothetical protein
MVLHTVLLKPRADLSPHGRRALAEAFTAAVREILTVRSVRIGRRVRHGAGYETGAPDGADFLVLIEFDDVAGLQAYLRHPVHLTLGERFSESLSASLVYDFEMGGLELLERLV